MNEKLAAPALLALLASAFCACTRGVYLGGHDALVDGAEIPGEDQLQSDDRGPLPDAATSDAAAPGDTLLPDEGAAVDQAPADTAPAEQGNSFKCGALLACVAGSEYCQMDVPVTCGGTAMPDSGVCPQDCKEVTCGPDPPECQCTAYSCVPLPGGCTNCACLTVGASCVCIEGAGGDIRVKCSV